MHRLDMLRVCERSQAYDQPQPAHTDRAERKRNRLQDSQFAAKHFWPQKNWPWMPSLHVQSHCQLVQSHERDVFPPDNPTPPCRTRLSSPDLSLVGPASAVRKSSGRTLDTLGTRACSPVCRIGWRTAEAMKRSSRWSREGRQAPLLRMQSMQK